MVPFVSIATEDSDYDNVSNLNHEGTFRLNIGVSKGTYDALFAHANLPQEIDYAVLDTFLPHPHYAQQFYVCIVNPSEEKNEKLKELITESHALATQKQSLRDKNKTE